MAANSENADRRVVPRWRSFREALVTNELSPASVAKAPSIEGKAFLEEKEAAWRASRHLPFAIDLVSAANVLGETKTAKEAAEFIMQEGSKASLTAQQLARSILSLEKPTSKPQPLVSRNQIISAAGLLKARRITQPRNAFVWMDLARLYVLLGQLEPAEQCLRIALNLAPSERFILRSTSRFYLHSKDPEHALALLRKNSRTPSDPWLIAAEVAVSSVLQKSPKFATAGKGILAASGVLPFHSSELASALASLEMYDGNIKRANKLFETSLREPTDNSLAQAVWASNKTGLGQIHRRFFQIPNAQEAMTFNAANHGRWAEVLVHAEKWAEDESFSSRPRLIASSTASSLLGNPKQGEEIARAGLETNPGHPGLLNNIAFALIEEGKPAEALRAIEEINKEQMTPVDEICVLATSGMANFRLGNAEIGRRLYEAAIHTTEKRKQPALKTLATLYLARERVLQGDVEGFKQFRKAYDEAKKFNDQPRLLAIADRLSPQIRNAEKKLSAI